MLTHDVVGAGRPVVLLHAAFSDRRVWGYQLALLGEAACAIAVDLPGFGGSPWDRRKRWHETAVAAVAQLAAGFGDDAPVIVGWGESAAVAADVVAARGAGRLVLVGACSELPDDRSLRQLVNDFPRFARTRVRASTSRSTSTETEDWLFAMAVGSSLDAQLAALAEPPAPLEALVNAVTVTGVLDALVDEAARPHGGRDVSLPCGHTPHVESPGEFGSVVLQIAKEM